MSVKEQLAEEIEKVPEPMLEELLDFARFLRTKAERSGQAGRELAVLSESSLSKDWLSPEEDAAWADL